MSYPYSLVKSGVTGDLLSASDYNNEHQNHINNNTPSAIDDASGNLGAMQTTVDPYPASVESLASTLEGELQRIRYLIAQITGKDQWYKDPDTSLATLYGFSVTGMSYVWNGSIASIPTGFLYEDGRAVSRAGYPVLFAAIGTKHGSGDGATTFNLPDKRGRFVRGQDDGTGRDPDAASRTANASGGNTGDNVGTIQGEAYKSHTHSQDAHGHTVTDPGHTHNGNTASAGGAQSSLLFGNSGTWSSLSGAIVSNTTGVSVNNTTATNQNSGGSETRPINAAVVWVIKT